MRHCTTPFGREISHAAFKSDCGLPGPSLMLQGEDAKSLSPGLEGPACTGQLLVL